MRFEPLLFENQKTFAQTVEQWCSATLRWIDGVSNKAAAAFAKNGAGSLIDALPSQPRAERREELLGAFPPSLQLWPVRVEGDFVFLDHPNAFEFMQRPF